MKAATENNILVVNNPSWEWCIEEVSNHAIALMLGCAKKMKQLDLLVAQGRWADAKKEQNPMGSIYNQTLGIIGCGAIGRMVARKAKVFGLNIIGYDPYIMHPWLAKENGINLVSFEEVLKADYVTLHPDLNETSFHMMNDKAFAQMKPSAYIINTSRGKVIDEVALVKALGIEEDCRRRPGCLRDRTSAQGKPADQDEQCDHAFPFRIVFHLCFLHRAHQYCQGSRQDFIRQMAG